MQQTYQFIDPAQLTEISDLELMARTVVEGFMTGLHRSPHSGSSIEFAQYRPYAQGDDLRFVDWKLYGRTDRLHLKQFQEETNLRCNLLLDCSASMDYASGDVTKFQYARMLVACIAMILNQQRDAIGFVAYHEELTRHIAPRTDRHHLRRIFIELENLRARGSGDTAGTLRFLGDVIQPRGMIILVSDLLHPAEEMINHLRSLRALRHEVIVFQISDPAEQTFPFERSATFLDAEDGREQFTIPDAVRETYLENRRQHFAAVRRQCLSEEIDLEEFTTDEPLDRALHHFIHRRNRMLQTGSRRRGRTGGGTR
ncbi:DUF58 domain-containing protein [Candidatus Sumerlaeota bacterium]|nr:DUF58 domain-containing protein [Candidatus Sumerlaeota bacterium]